VGGGKLKTVSGKRRKKRRCGISVREKEEGAGDNVRGC